MKKGYYIEEVLGKKKLFCKQKVESYRLCIEGDGFILSVANSKDGFEEIIVKYEEWKTSPLYRVFKLGSGEFQIFKKYGFWKNSDSYHPENLRYFDNLDDACKELLKYEKKAAREIREPVDCVNE